MIRCRCGEFYRRRGRISELFVGGVPVALPCLIVDQCSCGRFIPVTRNGMRFKPQIRAYQRLHDILANVNIPAPTLKEYTDYWDAVSVVEEPRDSY